MTPSLGRIVHYQLSNADAAEINRRRADGAANMAKHRAEGDGSIVHVGNAVNAGDIEAMIVTRVWSDEMVNGQVLLDGNDTLWVTSRGPGNEMGQWFWPERVD